MIAAIDLVQDLKLDVVAMVGLSKDALHVHVGLFVYFAALLLLRRAPGSVLPLAIVLCVAVAGEAIDMVYRMQEDLDQLYAGNLLDIWNTMFWPILITIAGRWGRSGRRTIG